MNILLILSIILSVILIDSFLDIHNTLPFWKVILLKMIYGFAGILYYIIILQSG